MKDYVGIVVGCVLLSCVLGICVDMVTAHVAVEYFSVHHPKIVESQQPWVLAIAWGIVAAWWFGLIAGLILGAVNHFRPERLGYGQILKSAAVACVVLWVLMIAVLISVYLFAGTIPLEERRPTFEHDRRLMAVAIAHLCEYWLGGFAVVVLSIRIWLIRTKANAK